MERAIYRVRLGNNAHRRENLRGAPRARDFIAFSGAASSMAGMTVTGDGSTFRVKAVFVPGLEDALPTSAVLRLTRNEILRW
jgi:hypothetical protein